jgi:hypothetical protein
LIDDHISEQCLIVTYIARFAGAMHLCQLGSFVLAPFSERIVFDINSKVCGTVWGFMQWIFEVKFPLLAVRTTGCAYLISNAVAIIETKEGQNNLFG